MYTVYRRGEPVGLTKDDDGWLRRKARSPLSTSDHQQSVIPHRWFGLELNMIEVKELRRSFGPVVAVDGISFSVGKGQVLGLLGPNGAGKTTAMRMLACYHPSRQRDRERLRARYSEGPARGPAVARLSGGELAGLSRNDGRRVPQLHLRCPADQGQGPQEDARPHRADVLHRLGLPPDDRDAVEGVQAPRRAGPGPDSRPGRC